MNSRISKKTQIPDRDSEIQVVLRELKTLMGHLDQLRGMDRLLQSGNGMPPAHETNCHHNSG